MASISEFRRKKLMHVFNVIFDFNHSGTIEEKDFELAIEKICRTRGWDDSNPKAKVTRETLLMIWDSLKTWADADKDNAISADEWCQMWSSDGNSEWQQRYMDFMFNLEDTSGDGEIDEEEYIKVYKNFSMPEDDAREAFLKFSKGKSVKITKDVFAQLWKEYFSSEDPNALGNFIFAKTNFD